METSAKNNTNVKPMIDKVAELMAVTGESMDLAMPTSLSAAGGAIKMSAGDDATRSSQKLEKKKKSCC